MGGLQELFNEGPMIGNDGTLGGSSYTISVDVINYWRRAGRVTSVMEGLLCDKF